VALLTVILGTWAVPWRIGWSGEAARSHPEKFLYWSILRSLQAQGCQTFDFNWVDLEEAEAIRNGSALPESANSGMTFFKMGFGGDLIRLPGVFDYFTNRWVRFAMRLVGQRLLTHPALQRVFRRRLGRSTAG
jgi:lipid II:glycine glycyltransferase (peptidoglycan interpeptide bridge formation enzyme)